MKQMIVMGALLYAAGLAWAGTYQRVDTLFQQKDSRGQVTNILVDGVDVVGPRRQELLTRWGGVGVVIETHEEGARITQVLPDTPGSRAGLQAEDIIVSVDDRPLKGYSLVESVMALRGVPGTRARLGVIRPGASDPLTIWVERDVIRAGPRGRDPAE